MGGCQNYGPCFGLWYNTALVFRDPKGDHNFDNHPYTGSRPQHGIGTYLGQSIGVLTWRSRVPVAGRRRTQSEVRSLFTPPIRPPERPKSSGSNMEVVHERLRT